MDEFLNKIAPYNLWNGNFLPVGFQRTEYTSRFLKFTGNRLVKVLTGQRRVGKSYLMRQVAMELIGSGVRPENTLFINRELSVFEFIQTNDDLDNLVTAYLDRFKPTGKIYVFIDEVQEIDNWEKSVNSMSQDYTKDIEVFISGSNSKLLSGELASLLSGRYVEFTVYPLSFGEYVAANSLEVSRASFLKYMNDGGLPELMNLPERDIRQRYVEGLRDSIMLKDIVKRYAIKDVGLLENLFAYIINNASNLISVPGIVNYLKSRGSRCSYDTISSYLSHLQDAFLVHKSERFNMAGKELLSGSFKLYANDQAYHNYLFPSVRFGSGYILENIVYMELLRKGYSVNTGIIKDKEIDFIAEKNGNRIYLQVAYQIGDEETARREYSSLEAVSGVGEKYLITLDDFPLPTYNGIRHIQAWMLPNEL